MPQRFFGQEIQVNVEGEVRQPVSFRLEGKDYVVGQILATWADHGFGSNPPRRRKWWQRHHRNYYRVRTTEGEVFEIYYDRGVSLKNSTYRKWYVSRRLDSLPRGTQSTAHRTGDTS